jgi:hypothetical protein
MLDDSPRGIITKGFFEYITKNNCEIVVENEIHKTESPKKESVLFFMKQLEFTKIPYCDESNLLARKYITENVLTYNHFRSIIERDCQKYYENFYLEVFCVLTKK